MKQLIILVALCFLCFPATAQKRKKYEVDPNAKPLLKIDGEATRNVCIGDSITFTAQFANLDFPEETKWRVSAGAITPVGSRAILNTAGLSPGSLQLTAELKEGECVAYDNRIINVRDCSPAPVPPPTPSPCPENLSLSASHVNIDAGEVVTLSTSFPGDTDWQASAGTLTESSTGARLDTTGVTPGTTIKVTAVVRSAAHCSATASTTLSLNIPPPAIPLAKLIGECTTFKARNARVDNACKAILEGVALQLEADPQAQVLVIAAEQSETGLATTRANNVADALSIGGIAKRIDRNRIQTRTTTGSRNVQLWLIPAGAKLPE